MHRKVLQMQAEWFGGCLRGGKLLVLSRMLRVRHQRDALHCWQRLLHDLHTLADEVEGKEAHARRVATWMAEALRDLCFHRVGADAEHDRQLDFRDHQRMQGQSALRDNHVRPRPHDRVDLLLKLGLCTIAPPGIDDEIFTLDVAQLAHAVAKRIEIGRFRARTLDGYPRNTQWLHALRSSV